MHRCVTLPSCRCFYRRGAVATAGIAWMAGAISLVLAAEKPAELPWKVNAPIATVKKELYRKHPSPGVAAVVSVNYVGPKLERMEIHALESRSDVHRERSRRFSNDNGKSWCDFQPLTSTSNNVYYNDVEVWEGGVPQFYDSDADVLVEMWLRQIAVDGRYNQSTYWRLSRDFGKTWSAHKMLRYEAGDEFDPKNPLAPGFLKTNQAYYGNNILKHSNGTLIHAIAHANVPGDPDNNKRPWRMGSLCFIGKWDSEAKDYQWTPGKRASISPDRSCRGLQEPEVAELKDGRVLVIWRGSNQWGSLKSPTPGWKYYSVSADGGMTLGPVRQLKYDDGSEFYSPASYHRMIRHSVTGKLYWIGNISAAPTKGNRPRYPLVIAEVDETGATPALKKDTVTAIDDRQPGQTHAIQFSNFSLLENRESHVLELYLTLYGEFASNTYDADCYRYLVTLQ